MCERVNWKRQELVVNTLLCFLSGLICQWVTDIRLSYGLRLRWTVLSFHRLRHHFTRSQIPSFTRLRCLIFTWLICPPSLDSDALLLKTQKSSFTRSRCPYSLDSDALLYFHYTCWSFSITSLHSEVLLHYIVDSYILLHYFGRIICPPPLFPRLRCLPPLFPRLRCLPPLFPRIRCPPPSCPPPDSSS